MKPARRAQEEDRLLVTRQSLVGRLADWEDRRNWQEFFDTYWRLIYGVARKAGLNDAEAQDVVQETIFTVAKNIAQYDRSGGSFKGWLLHTTRWRIADQFRKRAPQHGSPSGGDSSRGTATVERVADPGGFDLDAAWDAEWQQNLLTSALERVKRRVDPAHFQIFDCTVVKEWSAHKTATELGVNIAKVYLVKHRVSGLVKKELLAIEKER